MTARVLTALLSAGALVATLSTASPVQAGNDDNLKRFVGAAIGLYILGQAIENHNRGRVVIHHNTYRHGGAKWKQKGHKKKGCRHKAHHKTCKHCW